MPPTPPDPPALSTATDVVAWNCKARDNVHVARHIVDFIQEHQPAVFVALETQGGKNNIGGRRLDAFAHNAPTWTRITGTGQVGASAQIFVRPGIPILDHGTHLVSTRWRGPKSDTRNQRGRSFPRALVEIAGRPRLISADHLPWGPNVPENRDAFDDCLDWLTALTNAYTGADVLHIGDMNIAPSSAKMQAFARGIGGTILPGSGVDYAIYRPATAGPPAAQRPAPRTPTARPIGNPIDDHPAVIVNL